MSLCSPFSSSSDALPTWWIKNFSLNMWQPVCYKNFFSHNINKIRHTKHV
jgi:hypothetical protein